MYGRAAVQEDAKLVSSNTFCGDIGRQGAAKARRDMVQFHLQGGAAVPWGTTCNDSLVVRGGRTTTMDFAEREQYEEVNSIA